METIKRKTGLKYREKVTLYGKTLVSPWFSTKTNAREWKRLKLIDKNKIALNGVMIENFITVDELFQKYLVSRQDRAKRTIESYTFTYNAHLRPLIGKIKLLHLRLYHGEQVKQNLWEKGISPSRINDIIVQLKILFNFALKQGHLNLNPFQNLDKVKEQKREICYWSRMEVEIFLNANIESPYFSVYLIALNTGLRKSEICGLMWDCIDFNQRILVIKRMRDRHGLKETTKGAESRRVPMNEVTFNELKKLYENRKHPTYVFTKPSGDIISYEHLTDREFSKAILKANVRKIRFHDLRTTYASHFCINNGNVFALSKILGHKSVNITQSFYAKTNNEFLLNESERVSLSADKVIHENKILSLHKFRSAPF
jgi:integrase